MLAQLGRRFRREERRHERLLSELLHASSGRALGFYRWGRKYQGKSPGLNSGAGDILASPILTCRHSSGRLLRTEPSVKRSEPLVVQVLTVSVPAVEPVDTWTRESGGRRRQRRRRVCD